MSKNAKNDAIQKSIDELDKIIKTGDVNEMINCVKTMMALGTTPLPRQIAKISAHIYKTQNADLVTEFSVQYGSFGAFTDKLAEIVLEDGSAEDNFDFALYVPNADRLAHGKAIRRKRSKMWWLAFAKMWPNIAEQIVSKSATKKEGKDKEQAVVQER